MICHLGDDLSFGGMPWYSRIRSVLIGYDLSFRGMTCDLGVRSVIPGYDLSFGGIMCASRVGFQGMI